MGVFINLVRNTILILPVGENSPDENLVPVNVAPIKNFHLFIGDLNGFTKIVGSLDRVKAMINKDILTLNKTQVIHNQFEELLFPKLDFTLWHLKILAYCPYELRGILKSDEHLSHRTVRGPQLFCLQ